LVSLTTTAAERSSIGKSAGAETPIYITLIQVLAGSAAEQRIAIRKLRRQWQASYVTPLAEILRLNTDAEVQHMIVALLERKTGKRFGANYQRWHRWAWSQKPEPIENYAGFKSWLYGNIDPRFKRYFTSGHPPEIRLDEVLWGGVSQDGIPPLRHPKLVTADAADYLADSDVVFAHEINGEYRAYPKRIMGWHEMVIETVGDIELVGVYCTLCGAMIIYETRHDGVLHKFGTSGFLYRSNKLMYDKETQSLWNTFWGRPVIGPLTGKGISLKRRSIVTTTWGEWKSRHPQTSVLSLDTGYDVDYGEGVAYRDYFSTDKLMFDVPTRDKRLKNKAEILGIVMDGLERPDYQPLAIAATFLAENPIYYDHVGDKKIVVLTDTSGANRVFVADVEYVKWDGIRNLVDIQGVMWEMSESGLTSANGQKRERIPAHRAFWFGWYAAFNNTRLVH